MKDSFIPVSDGYFVTILFEVAPIDAKHLAYHRLAIYPDLPAHFVVAPLYVDNRETLAIAWGNAGRGQGRCTIHPKSLQLVSY